MSKSFTARLALVKPNPGTGENVSLTDLNGNFDKIDAAILPANVTSTTRPSAPAANQLLRESDTRRTYIWNATQGQWDQILTANGGGITIDTSNRLVFGTDVNLYRSAANVLKTDDAFEPASIVTEAKISVSYQNGWIDWGTPWQGLKYWKSKDGVVYIDGLIKGGTTTSGTTIFTLPVGYRPSANLMFMIWANTQVARVDIEPTGAVKIGPGNPWSATLNGLTGINFKGEQ